MPEILCERRGSRCRGVRGRREDVACWVVAHRRNLSRRVRAFIKWIETALAPYLERQNELLRRAQRTSVTGGFAASQLRIAPTSQLVSSVNVDC